MLSFNIHIKNKIEYEYKKYYRFSNKKWEIKYLNLGILTFFVIKKYRLFYYYLKMLIIFTLIIITSI
jgi:hypothetical protein